MLPFWMKNKKILRKNNKISDLFSPWKENYSANDDGNEYSKKKVSFTQNNKVKTNKNT